MLEFRDLITYSTVLLIYINHIQTSITSSSAIIRAFSFQKGLRITLSRQMMSLRSHVGVSLFDLSVHLVII